MRSPCYLLMWFISAPRSAACYALALPTQYTAPVVYLPLPYTQGSPYVYHTVALPVSSFYGTPASIPLGTIPTGSPLGSQYPLYPQQLHYLPLAGIMPNNEGLSTDTADDEPVSESMLYYQELLRAQLYRQLKAIRRAHRRRRSLHNRIK